MKSICLCSTALALAALATTGCGHVYGLSGLPAEDTGEAGAGEEVDEAPVDTEAPGDTGGAVDTGGLDAIEFDEDTGIDEDTGTDEDTAADEPDEQEDPEEDPVDEEPPDEEPPDEEPSFDGEYLGELELDITVYDGDGAFYASDACAGEVAFDVAEGGAPAVVGEGYCTFAVAANAFGLTFEGELQATGDVYGDVVISFNGQTFDGAWAADLDSGAMVVAVDDAFTFGPGTSYETTFAYSGVSQFTR